MPTYEYLCTECGDRREVVQSFTDASLTTCEVCGGKLRKVIYPVGIQFKGSGFYSTDRRASHPMSRMSKQDSKDSKDSRAESVESKGESSSDGKAETKSESKSDSAKSDSGSNDSRPKAKKAAEKTA
ncbi:MAG TPA: FmdB family zinc ribbon protein [Actinomycetota bacterium]|nr:FmdB family zinc ribbon protein [Actinomycetota bacterium]